MRTFAQASKISQQTPTARTALPARTHFGQRHEEKPRIHAQVSASQSAGAGFQFQSIPIYAREAGDARDKITQRDRSKADQSIGGTSVAATPKGLKVSADGHGLTSSTEFPDGFRWLQTVTTNDPSDTPVGAPLLPAPITYVDPRPNDDTKPFYWTDAEEAANVGHFEDEPGRPVHPTGTITWAAVLSLGGVNKKEVTRFDSVGYGFSLDSKGTVTTSGPSSPSGVADHIATLAAGFPGWTFK